MNKIFTGKPPYTEPRIIRLPALQREPDSTFCEVANGRSEVRTSGLQDMVCAEMGIVTALGGPPLSGGRESDKETRSGEESEPKMSSGSGKESQGAYRAPLSRHMARARGSMSWPESLSDRLDA